MVLQPGQRDVERDHRRLQVTQRPAACVAKARQIDGLLGSHSIEHGDAVTFDEDGDELSHSRLLKLIGTAANRGCHHVGVDAMVELLLELDN